MYVAWAICCPLNMNKKKIALVLRVLSMLFVSPVLNFFSVGLLILIWKCFLELFFPIPIRHTENFEDRIFSYECNFCVFFLEIHGLIFKKLELTWTKQKNHHPNLSFLREWNRKGFASNYVTNFWKGTSSPFVRRDSR